MHPQQKHARFTLVIIAIAVGLSAIACTLVAVFFSPKVIVAGMGFLGITGLLGFGGRFYRPKRESSIVMDERDVQIRTRARMLASGAQWIFWVSCCMIPYFIALGNASPLEVSFPVVCLPIVLVAAATIGETVWSISVLRMYSKDKASAES